MHILKISIVGSSFQDENLCIEVLGKTTCNYAA